MEGNKNSPPHQPICHFAAFLFFYTGKVTVSPAGNETCFPCHTRVPPALVAVTVNRSSERKTSTCPSFIGTTPWIYAM